MYTFYLRIFKMSYYQTKQDRRQKKTTHSLMHPVPIYFNIEFALAFSFYLFYSKFILCRLAGFAVFFTLSPVSLVLWKTYRCVSSIVRQKTTIVSCQRQQNKRMKTIRNLNASCYIKILVTKRLQLNLSTEKNSTFNGIADDMVPIIGHLSQCIWNMVFFYRTSINTLLDN